MKMPIWELIGQLLGGERVGWGNGEVGTKNLQISDLQSLMVTLLKRLPDYHKHFFVAQTI